MIYLASPHSHPDPAVRQARFEAACRAAGELLLKGIRVFSPIAHAHGLVTYLPYEANKFEFWREYDFEMIRLCERVLVLKIDGWKESVGVQAEIEYAAKMRKPVDYFDPADGTILTAGER